MMFGPAASALWAFVYGVALRQHCVHRVVSVCAFTTWVLFIVACRFALLIFEASSGPTAQDPFLAMILAGGLVCFLWYEKCLPFGFDWDTFLHVGVELRSVLLLAFPNRAELETLLLTDWLRDWDAWGATVVAVCEAKDACERETIAHEFVQQLQSLWAEPTSPPDWCDTDENPDSSADPFSGSDVEMSDEEAIRVDWSLFPFVGVELRPLLRTAFPEERNLRTVLQLSWVREMDSWGDTIIAMRDAPNDSAKARAGANFVAQLRRLLALHRQPSLPTNKERQTVLAGDGRCVGTGETHGVNDCFCDTLIQVASFAGVLPKEAANDLTRRREVSAEVRNKLNADDELRPRHRDTSGVALFCDEQAGRNAFLQAELHGPSAFNRCLVTRFASEFTLEQILLMPARPRSSSRHFQTSSRVTA